MSARDLLNLSSGHLDAAHLLLESGAICSENTLDGDRCHYAALNLRVRKLLKAYEARPPPLSPLPAALRELFISSYINVTYLERDLLGEDSTALSEGLHDLRRPFRSGTFLQTNEAPDVTFYVSGKALQAHRAILAARSPFFKRNFETNWRHRKEFRFSCSKLSFAALFSLLHFFYTDRLDVAVDDLEDLVRICKVCECLALQRALEKEINHHRFASFKSLRDADESQKRFILQGTSLPWQDGLHGGLRRLLRLTLVNSDRENKNCSQRLEDGISKAIDSTERAFGSGHTIDSEVNTMEEGMWTNDEQNRERREASSKACSNGPQKDFEEDHADVLFLVAGERFRCHRAILATRSEYFKARFFRAVERECERNNDVVLDHLPLLEEHDLSANTFKKLLEYIYTDTVEEIDPDEAEEMFDAASRYLLFPLKRAVVDVLLPHLETTPAELCHWLLMSDMYGVSKLREHCLDAMALNFELFAATPEFRQMLQRLPPPSGDNAARTSAPSAPGEVGGENQGNILDDLREKWLAIEGELDQRDESAREFDQRLEKLVEIATLEESDRSHDQDSGRILD